MGGLLRNVEVRAAELEMSSEVQVGQIRIKKLSLLKTNVLERNHTGGREGRRKHQAPSCEHVRSFDLTGENLN